MTAAGFTWFHALGPIDHDTAFAGIGIEHHNYVIAHALMIAGFLVLLSFGARGQLAAAKARPGLEAYYADEHLSLRNIFELLIEGIRFFMDDLLDKADVRRFLPVIGSLFLYIWSCNIIGIIPGFLPPTEYVNSNVGMAVISFGIFMWVGLSRDAVGFVKHLMGPVLPLAILLFPVECLSLVVRPVALVLRLTGNMFGDHTVFNVMSGLVPLGVPVIFLGLATLVSTIQAFVFSLLSVIYIFLSLPHHDDHDEAHAH